MRHNKEFHDFIMKKMMESIFSQIGLPEIKFGDARRISYRAMEYDCESNLTDEDMIYMHIDFALQNGDKETFMRLTNQLKAMSFEDRA